ncbi:hypothetical protein [Staphylococcus phage vB_ScaM-V1SC01]|nr:hypothetical protein [Staphylococcus phage vB_ScaM-V1SC01]
MIETDDPIDEENTIELSGTNMFKDDLCILIEELYCKAFVNGEPVIIRKYVEEML